MMDDYADAWLEWAASEAIVWECVAADGLVD
jgi:hypothetical protein